MQSLGPPDAAVPSAAAEEPPVLTDDQLVTVADRLAGIIGARLAPQPLLTTAEVAEWLNVGERTVESLVALGELPTVRVTPSGRGRRFERTAVEAFIRRSAGAGR